MFVWGGGGRVVWYAYRYAHTHTCIARENENVRDQGPTRSSVFMVLRKIDL